MVNEELLNKVNGESVDIERYVDMIVEPHTKDLTAYMDNLHKIVSGEDSDLNASELAQTILFLSTSMYALVNAIEKSALRQNVAKIVYMDKYNEAYTSQVSGTIADRKTKAELLAQEHQLIEIIYTRAYNKLKLLYDSADNCLAAIKKIMNLRVSEQQLTMRVNN